MPRTSSQRKAPRSEHLGATVAYHQTNGVDQNTLELKGSKGELSAGYPVSATPYSDSLSDDEVAATLARMYMAPVGAPRSKIHRENLLDISKWPLPIGADFSMAATIEDIESVSLPYTAHYQGSHLDDMEKNPETVAMLAKAPSLHTLAVPFIIPEDRRPVALIYVENGEGVGLLKLDTLKVRTLGSLDIEVRRDRRGRGIGTALLIDALRRDWPIDLCHQAYTPGGLAMVRSVLRELGAVPSSDLVDAICHIRGWQSRPAYWPKLTPNHVPAAPAGPKTSGEGLGRFFAEAAPLLAGGGQA